ncbi:MAG TPA: hypothetical protein VMU41_07400 [Candidatus Binataceae bacterium]|nr:hypothetical protein [Candidatus Binataceae bacterium]
MLETDPPAPSAAASLEWLYRFSGELIALVYIGLIAATATLTGAYYVMFPELGALSHEILARPRGRWASAPIMLVITPALTGLIGIIFTRLLPYGYVSVLLTVGGAVAVIEFLGSPIAPAISAGLLPLVVGITSWWYPPGIVFGTVFLAVLSTVQKSRLPPGEPVTDNRIDAIVASPPAARHWIPALFGFVLVAMTAVKLTGLRFILFPPLVVIAFEMLGHPVECPWTHRPWMLPMACFLTAAGGLICFKLMGFGPATAACSMGWGVLVLHFLKIHVPPALAVGLLPLVMTAPGPSYPFSVLIGTTVITIWFLAYRRWALAENRSNPS